MTTRVRPSLSPPCPSPSTRPNKGTSLLVPSFQRDTTRRVPPHPLLSTRQRGGSYPPCLLLSTRPNEEVPLSTQTARASPSSDSIMYICNVPLHLVTLPGNRTHGVFRGSFPMSRGPLIRFVTTSIMFLFHCLHCHDTRHYVIVTTLFSHPIIICPVIIVVRHIVRN